MSQNQIDIHIGRTKIFNTQHFKLHSHDFRQHLFFLFLMFRTFLMVNQSLSVSGRVISFVMKQISSHVFVYIVNVEREIPDLKQINMTDAQKYELEKKL